MASGTAAAAAGGVTSVACMANTSPAVDCPEQVAYVLGRAKEANGVGVYPVAALSKGLQGEEPTDAEALKAAGAIALSDDGCNVDNANLMRDALILARQLELAGCQDRRDLPFHRMLLEGQLPLTMGGGIGQSRLCMLMIGCCHIGEVQVSLWDQETLDTCEAAGVQLL